MTASGSDQSIDPSITTLSVEQIDDARTRARSNGAFVDPFVLRSFSERVATVARTHPSWARTVLGRVYGGVSDTWTAFLTLHYALEMEPQPPADPELESLRHDDRQRRETEQREQQQRRAALDDCWTAVRYALPVAVRVLYNYSGGLHLESYQSGADHIVVRDDFTRGRLRRRRNDALCTTASTARHQYFDTSIELPDDEIRLPSCQACLRVAETLVAHRPGLDYQVRVLAEAARDISGRR